MTPLHPLIAGIFKSANISPVELSPAPRGVVTHTPTGKRYLTKTQRDIPQMRGEVEGLCAMALTSSHLVPQVLGFAVGDSGKEAGMVTQYFDLGSSRWHQTQKVLANKLAAMHTPPPEGTEGYEGKYGFAVPTHCGVTEQDNTWEENWEVFFRDRRLGALVNKIGDTQLSDLWKRLIQRCVLIPRLLHVENGQLNPELSLYYSIRSTPPPKPVILHGDLWSGNAGYDEATATPVIYDPASYYGHNEADLGIMHMFGGFTNAFFDEYHKVHPRSQPHYDERQKLYELYHHLNHTLMFGGSYKSGAAGIMKSLIHWAEMPG